MLTVQAILPTYTWFHGEEISDREFKDFMIEHAIDHQLVNKMRRDFEQTIILANKTQQQLLLTVNFPVKNDHIGDNFDVVPLTFVLTSDFILTYTHDPLKRDFALTAIEQTLEQFDYYHPWYFLENILNIFLERFYQALRQVGDLVTDLKRQHAGYHDVHGMQGEAMRLKAALKENITLLKHAMSLPLSAGQRDQVKVLVKLGQEIFNVVY